MSKQTKNHKDRVQPAADETGDQNPTELSPEAQSLRQSLTHIGVASPTDPIYSLGYVIGQQRLPDHGPTQENPPARTTQEPLGVREDDDGK